MEFIELTFYDLLSQFKSVRFADLLTPAIMCCWFVLLFIPISKIDRRDAVSFMTYAFFMVFAGITMVFISTMRPMNSAQDFSNQFIFSLFLLPIVSVRWYWQPKSKKEVQDGKG